MPQPSLRLLRAAPDFRALRSVLDTLKEADHHYAQQEQHNIEDRSLRMQQLFSPDGARLRKQQQQQQQPYHQQDEPDQHRHHHDPNSFSRRPETQLPLDQRDHIPDWHRNKIGYIPSTWHASSLQISRIPAHVLTSTYFTLPWTDGEEGEEGDSSPHTQDNNNNTPSAREGRSPHLHPHPPPQAQDDATLARKVGRYARGRHSLYARDHRADPFARTWRQHIALGYVVQWDEWQRVFMAPLLLKQFTDIARGKARAGQFGGEVNLVLLGVGELSLKDPRPPDLDNNRLPAELEGIEETVRRSPVGRKKRSPFAPPVTASLGVLLVGERRGRNVLLGWEVWQGDGEDWRSYTVKGDVWEYWDQQRRWEAGELEMQDEDAREVASVWDVVRDDVDKRGKHRSRRQKT
ncbi:uncharacterized protein BP01DRAFT_391047 [Aspergillus saccharolyticus JOP 1030-1]|uniref:Uncharacterized protein n=1 Tax=Aspergillus saccharolyticus JOP 1030-1 TaxID=1450539 RepID=A0A318ZF89_9EURO|nr:hypothetical protein BP01DRAFT_391047 [Aspergillus saccharolyticus JOP 1030-1]PYH46206.1 hypothetical protein BP01DRAFT_391047 [Aspergillus saccharolyticus JOP 1030-1]